MGQIDALIAARVTSPAGIASGEVPVWNGTTWVRSSAQAVTGKLPGAEISYVEKTSSVSLTGTELAPTDIGLLGSSIPYDGSPVIVEFYGLISASSPTAGDQAGINLRVDGTDLGRLAFVEVLSSTVQNWFTLYAKRKYTPSAGNHTIGVAGWKAGTTTLLLQGGAGGAGTFLPAFVRITRA